MKWSKIFFVSGKCYGLFHSGDGRIIVLGYVILFSQFHLKNMLPKSTGVKTGLHRNTNAACENDVYIHVCKFVDCSAFAEAANRPYINILYANSLWCTDSQQIAFGCSLIVRHTAECCLPRLRNTSTSNVRIVFACHVRILFAIQCKHGFMIVNHEKPVFFFK